MSRRFPVDPPSREPPSASTSASGDSIPGTAVANLSPTGKPVPLTVTVLAVSTVAGVLAASAASAVDAVAFDLPAGVWAFLLAWAATAGYLSFRDIPSGVLAGGARFLAGFVVLVPVTTHGRDLLVASGTAGTGTATDLAAAGSDLLVRGSVALLVAGVLLVAARKLSRRAERLDRRRTRDDANRHF